MSLAKFKQSGNKKSYISEFLRLSVMVPDSSTTRRVYMFIDGLDEPLQGLVNVGIYRVSSIYQEPKVTAHKQITNQYTNIITWLKPSKRETVHGLSQCSHFRQFINIKRKVTYVSLING